MNPNACMCLRVVFGVDLLRKIFVSRFEQIYNVHWTLDHHQEDSQLNPQCFICVCDWLCTDYSEIPTKIFFSFSFSVTFLSNTGDRCVYLILIWQQDYRKVVLLVCGFVICCGFFSSKGLESCVCTKVFSQSKYLHSIYSLKCTRNFCQCCFMLLWGFFAFWSLRWYSKSSWVV